MMSAKLKIGKNETTCATCHRLLNRADADKAGLCVDCRPDAPPPVADVPAPQYVSVPADQVLR